MLVMARKSKTEKKCVVTFHLKYVEIKVYDNGKVVFEDPDETKEFNDSYLSVNTILEQYFDLTVKRKDELDQWMKAKKSEVETCLNGVSFDELQAAIEELSRTDCSAELSKLITASQGVITASQKAVALQEEVAELKKEVAKLREQRQTINRAQWLVMGYDV
jgi:predicted metalloprotease with PDZ domain